MRYGRSGTHPLQAWNGELPGTLPMLAGTGEAPCDVLPFHGQLLVTSWGHNRIEAYTYKTGSDSFEMKQKIIIQGSQNFRPVAFAKAKDGTLYFTDWVNRSYPVHGQGKVWKLSYTPGEKETQFPPLSKNEIKIKNLKPEQALLSLLSESIYLHQAVAASLAEQEVNAKLVGRPMPQRKAIIMARRWRIFANLDPVDKLDSLIDDCLADDSADLRFIGVRLIADYSLKKYKEKIISLASRPGTTIQLFKAICSAVSWLETGKVTKSKVDQGQIIMVKILRAEGSTEAIKETVLQFLPEDQQHLKLNELRKLFDSGGTGLKREALRLIIFNSDTEKFKFLAEVADDRKADPQLRADAITGLGFNAAAHRPLLFDLSESKNKTVAYEAAKLLGKVKADAKQPKVTDTGNWIERISEKKGDALAGWRAFFGPAGGQCYTCHKFQGKGKNIGPDLSTLAGQMSRERILESILLPDKEVGPLYQMWTVETKGGKTYTGSPHGEKGSKKTFVDIQGKEFSVEKKMIKLLRPMNKSMMPSGLEKILTYEDLNNIITLLQGK
jgi:putative heme-binding domain-containing protein